jgi:hypothetical protein
VIATSSNPYSSMTLAYFFNPFHKPRNVGYR